MPDSPDPGVPAVPEVRTRLRDAAAMLRQSAAVQPDVRAALVDLLDELDRALQAPAAPPAEVARLADGAAHLAVALHKPHDRGLLGASRDRLEGLVAQAGTRAPAAVTLARTLIDALAGMGI